MKLSHPKLTSKTCPACGMKLMKLPGYAPKQRGGLDEVDNLVCTKCQPMLPLKRG